MIHRGRLIVLPIFILGICVHGYAFAQSKDKNAKSTNAHDRLTRVARRSHGGIEQNRQETMIRATGPEQGLHVGPLRPIPPYNNFLGSQTGHLSVDWITPENFVVGREGDFELVLRNRGPVSVEQIIIQPVLPKGFELVKAVPEASIPGPMPTWRIEELSPQQETRIRLRLTPDSVGNVKGQARVTFSTTSSTAFRVVRPALTIQATVPESAVVGSQAVFNITVSNPGSGKTENTVLTSVLPEGLATTAEGNMYEIGVLNPGESRTIRIVAHVNRLGQLPCRFVAQADNDLHAEIEKELLGLGAKLELELDGPGFRYVTRPATYTARIKNTGTAPADNVHVRCAVPKPFAFLEAKQTGSYDASTKSINWFLGQLAAGEETEVVFKLRALAPGEFPINAAAIAERGHNVSTEHLTRVAGIAAILLEVVDVDDPVEVGSQSMYEVLITNQGTEFAENVQIKATVPEGMEIIGAQGPSQGAIEGLEITFTPLARLAPRADAIYRIKVRGNAPGDFRIEVEAMADTLDTPVTELESTKVYAD